MTAAETRSATTARMRLDEALVARGLAPSRSRARDMVKRGTVAVDGETETRPARMVSASAVLAVADPGARYVSRAALKLIAGLDAFGFDPAGLTVLDLGASTGGFTEVLLERGAAHVVAVDVGHGEMDSRLAADPRVSLIEGLNARDLTRAHLGGHRVEAITADLSFISLRLALPPALALAEPGAWGVFLVKPQFEAGRAALGKGGVVRDPELPRKAAADLASWLESQRFDSAVTSPSRGGRNSKPQAQEFREGGKAAELQPPSRSSPAAPRPSNFDLPSRGRLPASATAHHHIVRWRVVGTIPSPIAGGSGNVEFLLGARKD